MLQMISELKDETRRLNQQIQIQESKFSTQNLEIQALQEQLDVQRKYELRHIQTNTIFLTPCSKCK